MKFQLDDTIRSIHEEEMGLYNQGHIPSLLLQMKESHLSAEALRHIVSVRYQVAHFFEAWLLLIICTVKESKLSLATKEKLTFAAEQNLKEERGEEEQYGGPHKEGRSAMLSALGIDPKEWQKDLGSYDDIGIGLHPAALMLVDFMRSLASQGPVEAISALWYYENRISLSEKMGDYYVILKALEDTYPALKKSRYAEGDALWHIASHAEHDVYHAQLAETALAEADVAEKEQKIRSTCSQAKAAIDLFWHELI